MKNIILLLLLPVLGIGQDTVCIYKYTDDMTDKSYLIPSRKAVIKDMERKLAFSMVPFIESDFSISTINVKAIGFTGCNENDELILMFSDSTKIKMLSSKEFNCDGQAWFNIDKEEYDKLKNQNIIKAMFKNGKTYQSLSMEVPDKNRDYFVQLIKRAEQKASVPMPKK